MGNNYRKIEYDVEGAYGSTEKCWLYIKSNRTCDCVTVYDNNYNELFNFTEFGQFDMGMALVVAFSNWNDDRMKELSIEEIKKLSR